MEADKLSFIAITAIVAMVAVVGLLGNTQTTTQAPAQPQVIQDPAGNVIGHAGMFGGGMPGEHDGSFGSHTPVGDVDHEFDRRAPPESQPW